MRSKLQWLVNILAIILAVVCIGSSMYAIVYYRVIKEDYEAQCQRNSENIAKQESVISENNAELEKAGREEKRLKTDIETLSTEKTELSEKLDYSKIKICYLTFDDGPSENTLEILKVLKQKNVKATFFVTGLGKAEYMKNIVDEGHTIALHTYSHEYSKIYKSVDAYFNDLDKISNLVKEKTGVESKLIRFPGGSSNLISQKYSKGIMTKLTKEVEKRGYHYFDWNCDSGDADADNVPVKDLVANVNSGAKVSDHLTVLMHDTNAKDTTVKALSKIIDDLRKKGYFFENLTTESKPVHHNVYN